MKNDKKNIEELFKDYVPEVVEYDEEVDGSEEHKIRNEHLSEKEKLLQKFQKVKPNAKENKYRRKRTF
jgi:hypothetical protein